MLNPAHFFPIQLRGPHRPSSDPHHRLLPIEGIAAFATLDL